MSKFPSPSDAIKDKKVNVIYKGAETKTENGVSVSASPFDILLEEVGTFTPDKYISRAGATAWEADGDKLSITVKSKVEPKKGDYDVKGAAFFTDIARRGDESLG